MLKKSISLLLALVMLLSLAACNKTEKPKEEEPAKKVYTTYTDVYSTELATLNYLASNLSAVGAFAYLIQDGLIEYDQYGVMRPCLAESWEISDDQCVYTFHLRHGVKWFDCEGKEVGEVKAGDFVAALEWILNKDNASNNSKPAYNTLVGGKAYYDGETTDFSTVGVKALDDYTVQYTLMNPTPYFLPMLSNYAWFPAPADFLAEQGDSFGTSNDTLLYCGAYYLSSYEPEFQRTLLMNQNYWNKDIISIERINYRYNKEASANGPALYLKGETDNITLGSDIVEEWKADPEKWNQVHPAQYTNMSYFVAFNFNPTYDENDPAPWKIAVNNVDFRRSLFYAYDRNAATMSLDPYTYQEKTLNTISRKGLVNVGSTDYTMLPGLVEYGGQDNIYNPDKALENKAKALKSLEGKVSFPITVQVAYNVSSNATAQRYQIMEQQMENLLGKDYIDIVLVGYAGKSFNADIRNAGKWSMMELNWGPDYVDPVNMLYPQLLTVGGAKNFGRVFMAEEYYDEALGYGTFEKMCMEANAIVDNTDERYKAFALAEKFLLDEALAIPAYVSGGGYIASKIDPFTGWCAQMREYGARKLKGAVVLDHSMSNEEYEVAKAEYIKNRDAALAAAK